LLAAADTVQHYLTGFRFKDSEGDQDRRDAAEGRADMSPAVLEVAGLRHGYGERILFDQFDLALDQGEHRLLLAPSGTGKTTLINLIAGLLTPDAGEIYVSSESMSGASPARRDTIRRRHIGIVFQTLRLVSALSLRANLRLAQRLAGHARDDAAIEGLLAAVGLAARANDKPRRLSQGEMQRGAIARALVGRPALLIADEPTSALDDANAERIGRLLLETADANGSTLLIATHDKRLQAFIPTALHLAPSPAIA
jgi:putative ABC transport system ATP-binding protein